MTHLYKLMRYIIFQLRNVKWKKIIFELVLTVSRTIKMYDKRSEYQFLFNNMRYMFDKIVVKKVEKQKKF